MDSKTVTQRVSIVISYSLNAFFLCIKHAWGALISPYTTYRELSKGNKLYQVLPIIGLIVIYVLWVTVLRKGLHVHPFIITLSFSRLMFGIGFTFVISLFLLWIVGKMIGGIGTVRSLFLPWCYSLVPTLVWFFTVSILWFFLPPPRTISYQGQLFSLLFVCFSVAMLFWKLELYYLTFRFGMKLSLGRIVLASCLLIPLFILYSRIMYGFGMFRIPFM